MGAEPLYATKRTGGRRNRLDGVREAAGLLGLTLLPWQERVAAVLTEYTKDGPCWDTGLVTVPRQAGKTVLAQCLIVETALRVPEARIAYTAQTRGDAAKRVIQLGQRLARAGVDVQATRGIGNESIRFHGSGAEVFVVSPTHTGAHGESLDYVVLDETWAVDPIVLQGIVPARAARPESQMVAISTMGTYESVLLNDLVAKGRESVTDGRTRGLAYWEWALPEDGDPYDPAWWARYHPALGLTVTEQSIRSALEIMSPSEFVRAYCNRLVEATSEEIPAEWWEATAAPYADIPEGGVTIGIDVGVGPDSASMAVAWPTEAGQHVELADYRQGPLEWLMPRLVELVDRYDPAGLVMDVVGPANLIAGEVRRLAEDRRVPLRVPKSHDVAAACAFTYDGLRKGTLTHGVAEPLDRAVLGAVRKSFSDTWAWSRRQSRHDVSPLLAAALAAWSVNEQSLVPKPKYAVL